MIIVNADDWGRTRAETDAALFCYKEGRITSVSAMVFMEDSVRAADLAKDAGIDVGLHLNFTQRFTGEVPSGLLQEYHSRIVRFLTLNKYAFLFYNPALHKEFRYVYEAQHEEFLRLYGRVPSHIDGHQHMHLGTNMLLQGIIPKNEKVRRNFSFWMGEKNIANIAYRRLIDKWRAARYVVTDYFFDISRLFETNRMFHIFELARSSIAEIQTHPVNRNEYTILISDQYLRILNSLAKGTYASI